MARLTKAQCNIKREAGTALGVHWIEPVKESDGKIRIQYQKSYSDARDERRALGVTFTSMTAAWAYLEGRADQSIIARREVAEARKREAEAKESAIGNLAHCSIATLTEALRRRLDAAAADQADIDASTAALMSVLNLQHASAADAIRQEYTHESLWPNEAEEMRESISDAAHACANHEWATEVSWMLRGDASAEFNVKNMVRQAGVLVLN
jgi:hypothetical protein